MVNNEGLVGTTKYLSYIRHAAKADVISGFNCNLKYFHASLF